MDIYTRGFKRCLKPAVMYFVVQYFSPKMPDFQAQTMLINEFVLVSEKLEMTLVKQH